MCKVQRLREARWQGMTKQCGRPHIMRNDTASAPLAASRRALHVRHAPNPRRLPLISTTPAQCPVPTKREALIEVDLIRVSLTLCSNALIRAKSLRSAHRLHPLHVYIVRIFHILMPAGAFPRPGSRPLPILLRLLRLLPRRKARQYPEKRSRHPEDRIRQYAKSEDFQEHD